MGFVRNLIRLRKPEQNHNPLSSWTSISILLFCALSVASGFVLLLDKEFWFVYGHNLKELHEIFTTLMLVFVALHIGGVIADRVVFGHATYKLMMSGVSKHDSRSIIGMATFGLFSAGAFWVYGIFSNIPPQIKNETYQKECASCHFAYPADLYGQKSWQNIMENLDKHYGDSAELDTKSNKEIISYLANSAQSPKSVAIFGGFEIDGISASIAQNERFKRAHRHLPKGSVKPSCNNCHTDAVSGTFRLANIRVKESDKNATTHPDRR